MRRVMQWGDIPWDQVSKPGFGGGLISTWKFGLDFLTELADVQTGVYNVLEMLAMVVGACVFTIEPEITPEYARDSIL